MYFFFEEIISLHLELIFRIFLYHIMKISIEVDLQLIHDIMLINKQENLRMLHSLMNVNQMWQRQDERMMMYQQMGKIVHKYV